MAYAVIHRFAGATEDQYRASVAAVHPADGNLPEGQIFHMAGPSEDGWMIVAVHDSRESWERFRDGTLVPKMQAGIPGGFTAPPEEMGFEIRNQERSPAHTVIRRYSGGGTDELVTALEQRQPEIRDLIGTVPGFVSYTAFRTGDGGTTVTVCEDKGGTDESTRRAANWVAKNLDAAPSAPAIAEGDTVVQF
jgi:hypothetical protein